MSNAVFPILPGLAWGTTKKPAFLTRIQKSVNGRELRTSLRSSPIVSFSMKYEFLKDQSGSDDLRVILGFFLQRQGAYDSFLFTDVSDCSVTDHGLGIGDGIRTQFQLIRGYGGFAEPVMNINVLNNIKLNAATTSAYTIDALGVVTFATPPGAGVVVTWTGTYYYRCRFEDDYADFNNFMSKLWELSKLTLIGSLGNKI